ncbi:hypothetical protein TRFO_01587 [Tritrichomonas foetus]|uniref:Uncharacterized protein n=1 Tax=Tritrichomonas foetus TaxID=1144522 RepID=A0A1J4K288_9EUKA|nr:hypothetical protein TRFO_01587 [Tritrichomonas foetus]|eukprot:OHT03860.1 hypothetical protein TRFO_01587 [Tritrichomonas foetus]
MVYDLIATICQNNENEAKNVSFEEAAQLFSLFFDEPSFSDCDLDCISSFFPFRRFFDFLENSKKTNEKCDVMIPLILTCISHASSGKYFIVNEIIQEKDIIFLINSLENSSITSSAFYMIANICRENDSFIHLLFNNHIFEILSKISMNCQISNFLAFLSKSELNEFESFALLDFIVFEFNSFFVSIDEVHNEIQNEIDTIVDIIEILYTFMHSSIENVSLKAFQMSSDLILPKIDLLFNFDNLELIHELLKLLFLLPILPNSLIPILFKLYKTNDENIIITCSKIFEKQFNNWKNETLIDTDVLFSILLSKFPSSFNCEKVLFLTLMRYANFTQICMPEMIALLIKFVTYQNYSIMCLRALYKIATMGNNIDEMFGDLLDEALFALQEVANSEKEDIAMEAQIVLDALTVK